MVCVSMSDFIVLHELEFPCLSVSSYVVSSFRIVSSFRVVSSLPLVFLSVSFPVFTYHFVCFSSREFLLLFSMLKNFFVLFSPNTWIVNIDNQFIQIHFERLAAYSSLHSIVESKGANVQRKLDHTQILYFGANFRRTRFSIDRSV